MNGICLEKEQFATQKSILAIAFKNAVAEEKVLARAGNALKMLNERLSQKRSVFGVRPNAAVHSNPPNQPTTSTSLLS